MSVTVCSADGFFNAELTFPDEFPNMPPTMKFTDELWHPNSKSSLLTSHAPAPYFLAVYPDGKVCISILHTPGVDAMNAQETADERWRPIIGVETVLVSVLSMLSDPNIESPANIDAAVSRSQPHAPAPICVHPCAHLQKQFRDDVKGFKRRCRACVRATQDDSD